MGGAKSGRAILSPCKRFSSRREGSGCADQPDERLPFCKISDTPDAQCPKFHVLKYNYSICAGQSVADLCFRYATFVNSKIWDICVLDHPRDLATAGLTGPVGPM